MYSILHSRICIPADKDWNIIPNMYMKYIFDEIFQIYFKNIFTLFVCDIHSHLRYVYIPKLPQYNYTYVFTLCILKTDLFCVTK